LGGWGGCGGCPALVGCLGLDWGGGGGRWLVPRTLLRVLLVLLLLLLLLWQELRQGALCVLVHEAEQLWVHALCMHGQQAALLQLRHGLRWAHAPWAAWVEGRGGLIRAEGRSHGLMDG
jgi:hypothetical protein